jgi:hypothetical protein
MPVGVGRNMYGFVLLVPLFAWLGYREAAKFSRENGRPPWGIHPGFWALLAGISLLLGAVMLLIARRTTEPVSAMSAPAHRAGRPLPASNGHPVTAAPVGNPWEAPPAPVAPVPASQSPYQANRNILPGG